MSMSPGNDDPREALPRSSESPDEQQGPIKTRYGRIIVPKRDLPGEDQLPKDRRKKGNRNETIKAKRKYTKRKERTSVSNDQETLAMGKKDSSVNEKKVEEVMKDIKEEEPEPEEMGAQRDSDGEEYDIRPDHSFRYEKSVPETSRNTGNNHTNSVEEETKPEACDICGMVMEKYKMELHKLDNHPQYAPYECLSCRIRSFFDYWELKEHYKICSNERIACEGNKEAAIYSQVIEAAFFRKVYQPVECPFCRIYLGTFFDLDVHFNAHGLGAMDSKFACDGCKMTFISVDALKKHLTKQNTPRQSMTCFNTGRVLNRREIEKLKERYTDEDRMDCMRKFDHDTYVLASPKILECEQEATCAYCAQRTRAYAHLKTDLSNLLVYGLECSEDMEKKIIEKMKEWKEKKNDRITICRHHFQWRNWKTRKNEGGRCDGGGEMRRELAQTVIRRKTEEEKEDGITVVDEMRVKGNGPSFVGDQCNSGMDWTVKMEEENEEEMMFQRREVKEEELDWDEMDNQERCEAEGVEMDYDVIDISDEEDSQGGGDRPALPLFMNEGELEEKVSTCMRIGYNCPVCENSFPNLNDLHFHGDVHPETRILYLCADCPDKSYLNPEEVFKHFDEKKKSAVAAFYSFKVIVQAEKSDDLIQKK